MCDVFILKFKGAFLCQKHLLNYKQLLVTN